MDGDEAFYYLNKDGQPLGGVITYVNDFNMAGDPEFVEKVLSVVERELTVSKIEEDTFRFTGLDIKVVTDGIKISMEGYSQNLKDIQEIRKVDDRNEELSKVEMKLYRKMTSKIAWLANSTRPDLCYLALQMSKKNQGATIADLREVNRILKRVRERES